MAISSERGKLIFRKTERDLLRLASDHTPDIVHSFRTTSRRLQVLLEQLIPGTRRNQKKLLKVLARIRRKAGHVRDLDAQLSALRRLKVSIEPRRKTEFTQHLLELREKHESKLSKLLKKRDVRETAKRLRRALRDADLETQSDPLTVARQMLHSVPLHNGRADEAYLHKYRVAVKRARYAAEFAPKSAEATQFIAQLQRLQNALGHWHDWLILTQTATEHLGEINQSPLVAALNNVTRGKFRLALSEMSASNPIPATAKSGVITQSGRKVTALESAPAPRTETAA
jgi:CHAD domain-containing protein